ncbi:hypothetical protein D3C75_1236230 [compost metagenome]
MGVAIPSKAMVPATTNRSLGFCRSCPVRSVAKFPSELARVTIKPDAVEIIKAGIWLTRPSPMDIWVNRLAASEMPILW